MQTQKLKAIVLLGVCAVVLIAALWLLLGNLLTADWTLHVYAVEFKNLPRRWVLLAAAAVGVVVYLVMRYCLPAGWRALRAARGAARAKSAQERLERLESQNPRP